MNLMNNYRHFGPYFDYFLVMVDPLVMVSLSSQVAMVARLVSSPSILLPSNQ